jgi:hypothetical protein
LNASIINDFISEVKHSKKLSWDIFAAKMWMHLWIEHLDRVQGKICDPQARYVTLIITDKVK